MKKKTLLAFGITFGVVVTAGLFAISGLMKNKSRDSLAVLDGTETSDEIVTVGEEVEFTEEHTVSATEDPTELLETEETSATIQKETEEVSESMEDTEIPETAEKIETVEASETIDTDVDPVDAENYDEEMMMQEYRDTSGDNVKAALDKNDEPPTALDAQHFLEERAWDYFDSIGCMNASPFIMDDPVKNKEGGWDCYIGNSYGTTVLYCRTSGNGKVDVGLYGSQYNDAFPGICYSKEGKEKPYVEEIERKLIEQGIDEKVSKVESIEGKTVYLSDIDGNKYTIKLD